MTDQYASADPSTFVKRGFMTGREMTLAGVRAVERKTRSGESSRSGIQFLFEEKDRNGEKRIMSGFAHMGAWGDQLIPSENGKGLSPVKGADKPFVEAESELGFFNAALLAAGFPKKLMTGNYQKYVGMVLVLEEKTLPSFRRKKSVDPDEAAVAVKEYKTEVPSKIVTLPEDNSGYKGLTEKEITAHLKERQDKMEARKAASSEDAPEEAAATTEPDEEDEPKPKGKKKAPKVEEEEAEDSFSDDGGEEAEEEAAEEPAEEEAEEEEDNPAEALATKLILKVLKASKKVKGSELLQKVHPLLLGTDKKTQQAVSKLATSPKFIGAIEGVSIKGNMVVLG